MSNKNDIDLGKLFLGNMEEIVRKMSKKELLNYLEEISKDLDNIALDQIQIAIMDLKYQIKELGEKVKELEEENLHWRGQYHLVTRKIDVIPKQKIKDKIEEIKKEYNKIHAQHYRDCGILEEKCKAKKEVLGELLQESEDK